MPPSPPHYSDKKLVLKSATYYTNEDIQFLHEVVAHAQELLPTLPERERVPTNALFTAYYTLLPSIGIDADHDSNYARVLFKIGGTRSAGSLYEKFETVLAQMGIVLEFDAGSDRDGVEHIANEQVDQEKALSPESVSKPTDSKPFLSQHRRNSESSAWDTGTDPRTGRYSRNHSQSPNARSTAGLSLASLRSSFSSPFGPSRHEIPKYGEGLHEGWRKQNLRPELKPDDIRQISHFRTSSTNGSMRIRRRSPQPSEFELRTASTCQGSNDEDSAVASLAQTVPMPKPEGSDIGHHGLLIPNSQTLMVIKVSLLVQYRNKHLLRRHLAQWKQGTMQLKEDNGNLQLLASHRDKQILLRQAFDSWQSNLRACRQAAETESFFVHLECRADRARDIFILTKALLHWTHSADDEKKKTSVARRHILRTRYFEAWRGLTAVNELKVRRQVLKKFLAVWHDKYLRNNADDSSAMVLFAGNLAHRLFWSWYSIARDHKALAWCATKIMGRSLQKWVDLSKKVPKDQVKAFNRHRFTSTRNAYLLWTLKRRESIQHSLEADVYRKGRLSFKVLHQFSVEYSLYRPTRRLVLMVSNRLKRIVFVTWLSLARQEKLAADVDRLKIKRDSLVAWKDNVRCRTMQSRIGSRLLLKAFRAWTFSEREILSTRLFHRTLARDIMYRLAAKSQASVGNEMQYLRTATEFAYRRLSNNALTAWRTRCQVQVQQINAASDFSTPRVSGDSLVKWVAQTRQIAQLQTWAEDGEFYILVNKTFKLWKNGTDNSKRDKRRIAYVSVRRRNKLNLARNTLSIWRKQTLNLAGKDRRSVDFKYDKDVLKGTSMFDRWRRHIDGIAQLDLTSQQVQSKKYLRTLNNSLSAQYRLEREASALFIARKLTVGVKKWARVALQLRASQHVVSELRERYGKKTLRRIIYHWHQRIAGNVSLSNRDDLNQERPSFAFDKKWLGVTDRAEAWSEFEDDPDIDDWAQGHGGEIPSSTIPGYLSTPSKKMSEARMIRRFSSTTPVAPLSTPFEKHLRAQYSSSVPFRRLIGKSQLGNDIKTAKHEY